VDSPHSSRMASCSNPRTSTLIRSSEESKSTASGLSPARPERDNWKKALNARYAPTLKIGQENAVEIRDNPASPTGFDIHFVAVRVGTRFDVKGHLTQEQLDVLHSGSNLTSLDALEPSPDSSPSTSSPPTPTVERGTGRGRAGCGSSPYSHPHPPVTDIVRLDGEGCVGLFHSRHLVRRELVKLE